MERTTPRGPPGHPHQVIMSLSLSASLRAGPGARVHSNKLDIAETKMILVSGEGLGPRPGVSA